MRWAGLETDSPLSGNRTAAGGRTIGEIIKTYGALMNQPTLQLTNPFVKYAILIHLVLLIFFAVHCLKSSPGLRSSNAVAEEIFDYSLVLSKKMVAPIAPR
jgi:hypothetical protein